MFPVRGPDEFSFQLILLGYLRRKYVKIFAKNCVASPVEGIYLDYKLFSFSTRSFDVR